MEGQREVEARKKWRPKGDGSITRGERLEGSRGQNTVKAEMGWEAGGK